MTLAAKLLAFKTQKNRTWPAAIAASETHSSHSGAGRQASARPTDAMIVGSQQNRRRRQDPPIRHDQSLRNQFFLRQHAARQQPRIAPIEIGADPGAGRHIYSKESPRLPIIERTSGAKEHRRDDELANHPAPKNSRKEAFWDERRRRIQWKPNLPEMSAGNQRGLPAHCPAMAAIPPGQ